MLLLNSVRTAPWVRSAVAIAVFGLVAVEAGFAATSDVLEPVIVTANRVPQPLGEALADVTVITREDIERQAHGDIATLLSRQAGFELARNGGPGTSTSLFLRGADSRFTAVLVDGVRVDSQNLQGGVSWAGIPLSTIERIEIVRGPAGALYGSDAVSGVVQIFTRKGHQGAPRFDVGSTLGSHGTVKWDANVSGGEGIVDYSLTAARERASGGRSAIVNRTNFNYNPDDDGYEQANLAARFGLQATKNHRIELSSTRTKVDAQFDEGTAPGPDAVSQTISSTLQTRWLAQWTPDLSAVYSIGESTDAVNTGGTYPFETQTRIFTATAQHDLRLGDHSLQAILERRADRLTDDSSFGPSFDTPVKRRDQKAVSLGYGWENQGRAIQFKVRQDDDSEFGNHTTGTVAGGWPLTQNLRLRSSFAKGFRAPTLYERFATYGGSPDLQPETANNAEVGLQWVQGASQLSVSAYQNRIKNLINYDLTTSTYTNVGQADLRGLEFSGSWAAGDWRVAATLDVQDPRNETLDKLLVRRARTHGNLDIEYQLAGWSLGTQVKASGARYDDAQNTRRLGGYALLNLFAQRQLTKQWNLLVKVDNVFDKNYATARDYSMPGIGGYVAVRFTPSN